jgi:putative colanic acid biosynthesis UDP-glucose lipid carrier transferase
MGQWDKINFKIIELISLIISDDSYPRHRMVSAAAYRPLYKRNTEGRCLPLKNGLILINIDAFHYLGGVPSMVQASVTEHSLQAPSTDAARKFRITQQATGLLVALSEIATITFGSALGQIIYEQVVNQSPSEINSALGVGVLSSVLYVSVAKSAGLYRLPTLIDPVRRLPRIATCCGVVLLAVTGLLFLLKIGSEFSRGALLAFATIMVFLCAATRILVAGVVETLIKRNAIVGRSAYVIGDVEELASLTSPYLFRQFGLHEVGRYVLARPSDAQTSGYARQIEDALKLARISRTEEFVIALNGDSLESLNDIETYLRATPLPVSLLPNRLFRSVMDRNDVTLSGSAHLVEVQRAPMTQAARFAKRAIDIAVAISALIVLSPLFLIAMLAIKADSRGPVIFKQRRNGFNEHEFSIYKFRTMTVMEDGDKIVQARRSDKRITRVGRLLRRSSIDELPQLYNVIKGEMSLIGPRPHALAHDSEYKAVIGDYCMRHHVKPGLTGWAQIHGLRGETARTDDMRRRVKLDLWYIDNWSLSLDIQILLRTVVEVTRTNAY